MSIWSRKRRYPGQDEALQKYVYLSDSEVLYRLATTDPLTIDRLDTYYAQLVTIYSERGKAITFYSIVFAASILAAFNAIREASVGGITVSSDFLKHAALIIWPWAQCRLGILEAKYSFVSGLFKSKLARSSSSEKVDILARYPLAISFEEYYIERIGNLPLLIRLRVPVRLIAFVVLISICLLAYIAFSLWVYLTLIAGVIQAPSPVPKYWSWSVVVASLCMMLFSYSLPTTSLLKKRYTHMGLVRLMDSLMNRNRARYATYVSRILAARQRLDLAD